MLIKAIFNQKYSKNSNIMKLILCKYIFIYSYDAKLGLNLHV